MKTIKIRYVKRNDTYYMERKSIFGWKRLGCSIDMGYGGYWQSYTSTNKEDVLANSFLSPDGTLIGRIDDARWYIKNKLIVDEDYPHGVAAVITHETYGTDNPIIEGMYGYTHRGGQMFKIGDRLFDEEYNPIKEDYEDEQWNEWETKFNELYENEDELGRRWMDADGISYVIPFKLRGSKIIETMGEAFEAAKNMSNYLS